MKKSTLNAVCVSVAALVAVQVACADDKHTPSPRGREVFKAHHEPKPRAMVVYVAPTAVKASPPKKAWIGHTVSISNSERDAIRAYLQSRLQASKGGKFNGVPQGLAKKVAWGNTLPDGWQKNCVRGRVLAPEVHEHCQPLPYDLTAKLPPPPPGTVLLAVDGTVVRVGYPTYEILDTFDVHAQPAQLTGSHPARPAAVAARGAYSEIIPIVPNRVSTN